MNSDNMFQRFGPAYRWLVTLTVMTGTMALGLASSIPALSAAALRAVPTDKLARGTSSSNFFLTLGGGFGVTLLTAFFQHRTRFHGEAIVATQTPANKMTLELLDGIQQLLAGTGMTDLAQARGALDYLSQVVLAQLKVLTSFNLHLSHSKAELKKRIHSEWTSNQTEQGCLCLDMTKVPSTNIHYLHQKT